MKGMNQRHALFAAPLFVAALLALRDDLSPALDELRTELTHKAAEFDGIVKTGRTHLQDATPIRLGQEFAGYARMVERGRQRLDDVRPVLEEVPLGGTAVGTGLNTHPEFAARTLAEINTRTGLELRPSPNFFEGLGSRHALVWASGAMKTLACG